MARDTLNEGFNKMFKNLLNEDTMRDDIDADADDKKEYAKKAFMKKKDSADSDKDYKLKKADLKEPEELKETVKKNDYIEIYFEDLNEDAQREILEYFKVSAPEDMNWDVEPLTIISMSDLVESTKRDDIDADADDKKEVAKKAFAKKKDDADSDKDYKLRKAALKEPRQLKESGAQINKSEIEAEIDRHWDDENIMDDHDEWDYKDFTLSVYTGVYTNVEVRDRSNPSNILRTWKIFDINESLKRKSKKADLKESDKWDAEDEDVFTFIFRSGKQPLKVNGVKERDEFLKKTEYKIIDNHNKTYDVLDAISKKPATMPLREADKPAATSIEDAQKWVDYDMKKYGKISEKTNNLVKKAGFQIIKDNHGDYEVAAGKFENYKRVLEAKKRK